MSYIDFEQTNAVFEEIRRDMQTGPSKNRNQLTDLCLKMDDLASLLVGVLYEKVSRIDAKWHESVFRGLIDYEGPERAEVVTSYELAAAFLADFTALAEELGSMGGKVEGASRVREALGEIRGIMTPDGEFFDDARLIKWQSAALEADLSGETTPFEELGD